MPMNYCHPREKNIFIHLGKAVMQSKVTKGCPHTILNVLVIFKGRYTQNIVQKWPKIPRISGRPRNHRQWNICRHTL